MNLNENPYHPPADTGQAAQRSTINWRRFCLLNLALLYSLALLVLVSFLWSQQETFLPPQDLGRRYASYDREYKFYPLRALARIVLIFAVPNLVFFAVHFKHRFSAQQ